MTPAFEQLQKQLKRLPGLGYRSAERIALYLTLEKPEMLGELAASLQVAGELVKDCEVCGNLAEESLCTICKSSQRDSGVICVVEHVPDLCAIERANVYQGAYHVLHGKLSPIQGVHPEDLNLAALSKRLGSGEVREIILALGNDLECEATCHYIQNEVLAEYADAVQLTRIGFGIPSGGGVVFADSQTLRSAFDGRRDFSTLTS